MGPAHLSTKVPDFEALLGSTAAEVDALLDEILGVGGEGNRLVAAMRYALLGGGKRLRPFLLIESAGLLQVPRAQALRAGAALECIHSYSLIHDDLPAMDDDDLRRGKPTVHKAFDEATAILAGDALHTLAFEIVGAPDTHPDPAIRVELVSALAKAAGKTGMAGGQMLDLSAGEHGKPTLAEVMRMQAMKTGALFGFACEAGAILGHGSSQDRNALRNYSDNIGLAFQIVDDILDVESSADQLGKTTQKDARAGKATYVDLLGLAGAKQRAQQLVDNAKTALAIFGDRAAVLITTADFMIQRPR
jgi:farnesyl diphosphate synthase